MAKDTQPNRDNLGLTGPEKMPPDSRKPSATKHPHPGNIGTDTGSSATDDPHGKVDPGKKK
jgi:hypothetical protein